MVQYNLRLKEHERPTGPFVVSNLKSFLNVHGHHMELHRDVTRKQVSAPLRVLEPEDDRPVRVSHAASVQRYRVETERRGL